MYIFKKMGRWLPLAGLMGIAFAYEPFRSGFVFANQPCELVPDWQRVHSAFFNFRHILAYGVLFWVMAATLRQSRFVRAAIAVFLFSVFIEIVQSYFITGHCRSWDLIPNLVGIGLAAAIFKIGILSFDRNQRLKSVN